MILRFSCKKMGDGCRIDARPLFLFIFDASGLEGIVERHERLLKHEVLLLVVGVETRRRILSPTRLDALR